MIDYKKIKERVEDLYKIIDDSKKELEELRSACDHPESEEVNYMWRIGSITKAYCCKVCREIVKPLFSINHEKSK